MKITEIMSQKLITGEKDETLGEIANKMKKENIGFLLIKEKNKIIGVITDRDIALALSNQADDKTTVEPYMTKELITIKKDSNIEEALEKMATYKIKRILVEDEKIIGILSLSDILTCDSYKEKLFETIKQIWKIHPNLGPSKTKIDEFNL